LEAVELATLDWVDWFNNKRLLEPIGYIPPAEFEQLYYEAAAGPTLGVGLK
jgi:transposase InsO family protein